MAVQCSATSAAAAHVILNQQIGKLIWKEVNHSSATDKKEFKQLLN
jgi:hypothetical protein